MRVVLDFLFEIIWLLKILIIYLHHKQTINNSQYEEIYSKNIHWKWRRDNKEDYQLLTIGLTFINTINLVEWEIFSTFAAEKESNSLF